MSGKFKQGNNLKIRKFLPKILPLPEKPLQREVFWCSDAFVHCFNCNRHSKSLQKFHYPMIMCSAYLGVDDDCNEAHLKTWNFNKVSSKLETKYPGKISCLYNFTWHSQDVNHTVHGWWFNSAISENHLITSFFRNRFFFIS